jgi:ABC-type antimicrobial peptide transport system permease subunit
MEFMRDLGVPVPKVLAWSSNAENEVGAEYIIMEKVQGIQLKEVWDVMPSTQKCRFLADLVSIEAKMLSILMVRYITIRAMFPTVNWYAGKKGLLSSASVPPFVGLIGRVRRLEWTSTADRVSS